MRVDQISLHRVRLPLVHAFETSSHRKNHLEHVLVAMRDESGAIGWGEIASPSDPYYSSETVDTAWIIARRYLAPAVLGVEWEHPSEVHALWRRVRGHQFTCAGFDAAAWVLWAERQGTSLAHALGGTRDTVTAGVSLGIEASIEQLLKQIQLHVAAGYRRVKLKIAPGWDEIPVDATRNAFPDLAIQVDGNGAYESSDDNIAHLARLDSFGLDMIEQPFAPRDFVTHAKLQSKISTPVCLDESIETVDDIRTMLKLDAGRVVNIKASRMGGLSLAVAAHDLAFEHEVPVWCGGMHEFGIGRAANVALSSLPGFTMPSDVSGSEKYYARDVIVPPVIARDGIVSVPRAPGLGFQVDTDFIKSNEIAREIMLAPLAPSGDSHPV